MRRLLPDLSELSERVLELAVIRLIARVVERLAVADGASLIYDDHSALGDVFQPDHVRIYNIVGPDRLLVVIAEQRESEPLLVTPGFEREERIGADAIHLCAQTVELGHRITQRAHFGGADAAVCGRKERQDDVAR